MGHYKSNVRDQVFALFDVLGLDKALGAGTFADLDADTVKEMIHEMARLAEGPIAESFADGDRNPPVFDPDTHTVTLPESFKASVRAYIDGGWNKVDPGRGARRHAGPQVAAVGPQRAHPGCQPGRLDVRRRRRLRADLRAQRHRRAEEVGRHRCRQQLGRHHGADRARRGF